MFVYISFTGLYLEESVVEESHGPRPSLAAAALALEPPVAVQHALSLILLALHITQVNSCDTYYFIIPFFVTVKNQFTLRTYYKVVHFHYTRISY